MIYLDESGDLGFGSSRGSRYFVVAALGIKEPMRLRKIVKRVRESPSFGRREPELCFHNESDRSRKVLLDELSKLGCWISWEALDKKGLEKIGIRWSVVYNSLCADALSELVLRLALNDVRIIVDKFYTNSRRRFEMSEMVARRIANRSLTTPRVRISHESSMNVPGLQVCDFVAGSIFQNLERGKKEYYDLIRDNVIFNRIEKECRPWGGV